MDNKYILVEHKNTINKLILETFDISQRIKFTSFDVVKNYFIFGANSGGIYVFKREPIQFLKLIPSVHGPVVLLKISENEKNLALSTSSGFIIVLENCFTEVNFQQQIYGEHEGQTVTVLKWNGDDLYCGDNSGKVSLVALKNFLGTAIFQSPLVCLMQLETSIFQIDTFSKFLLISTSTRTVLCDTETEKYRQIGKKNRDVSLGSCFLNVPLKSLDVSKSTQVPGFFTTMSEDERFASNTEFEDTRIYCSRPGVRFWEVNIQGDIIFTHQFCNLLNQTQSDLIYLDEAPDVALNITTFPEKNFVFEDFKCGKIYSFLNKYLLTFHETRIYIFEPHTNNVWLWCSSKNIKDIKIVDCYIYIWQENFHISKISLNILEDLILKSLYKQQFNFCAQLCIEFNSDIYRILETSEKIHLISILESKLQNNEVLVKLKPLLNRLKQLKETSVLLTKFKNGVITLNNTYALENTPINIQVPTRRPLEIKGRTETKKTEFDIIYEQFNISKANMEIETSDFINLIKSKDSEQVLNLLNQFSYDLELNHGQNCNKWIKVIYLKILSKNFKRDLNNECSKFAAAAFLEINGNKKLSCNCNFPLPKTHFEIPKFYNLGCALMEELFLFKEFSHKVPYMYRYILENVQDSVNLKTMLPLLIQFSDFDLYNKLLKIITYDIWDESIQLLIKLKTGNCLNCNNKISIDGIIEWKTFALLIVNTIGSLNALKLLKRYSNFIPKGTLDADFYQFCIRQGSIEFGFNNNTFKDIFSNESMKINSRTNTRWREKK